MKKWVGLVFVTLLVFSIKESRAQYAPDANVPDSVWTNEHSPHKATFYSAVLPGLGQIYNQKYWKVPIIYAAFGGLIYYANYNNFVYQKYYTQYKEKKAYDNGWVEEDPYPGYSLTAINNQKDIWRRNRDLCFIGIGVMYVMQIIDADVDAHLFDYDISEDLSMRFEPVILQPSADISYKSTDIPLGLRCSVRF